MPDMPHLSFSRHCIQARTGRIPKYFPGLLHTAAGIQHRRQNPKAELSAQTAARPFPETSFSPRRQYPETKTNYFGSVLSNRQTSAARQQYFLHAGFCFHCTSGIYRKMLYRQLER